VLFLIACNASTVEEDLQALFTQSGIEGTIIISSEAGETEYIAYPERAKAPFLPASTFKIPNTLIALEEAVITSPDDTFKWDGKKRFVDAWNQDHSLRTAFPVSCVWYYQELARRLGNETYLDYLQNLNYGNKLTGPELTRFWLEGDLRITAEEQIAFLKSVYKQDLPFRAEHFELLKELMLVEQTDAYSVYAKTGWAVRDNGEHGWWVGYVEKTDKVWFFCINIEITANEDYGKQKEIARSALQLIGVLPVTPEALN